jgi:hypothetical protein
MKTRRTTPLLTIVCSVFLALASFTGGRAGAAELLRNADLNSGLSPWKATETISGWNPHVNDVTTGGHANLHPPGSYQGPLLRQSLNVTGIANRTITVSGKLRKISAPLGNTISLRIQYVSTANEVREVDVVKPDNDAVGDWTAVSADFTFPADARKMTAFIIYKGDYGDFDGDDFSISASGVTVGTIPVIYGATPIKTAYGSPVIITGTGFGSSTSTLRLRAASNGITIQNWSDTQITAVVQEPARSGMWTAFNDYVEADSEANCEITSPNFTVDVIGSPFRVIKGTSLSVPLKVNLLNGFSTTGGIGFLVPEAPAAASFAPANTKNSGGVLLTLNTGGLNPGKHSLHAQTLENNSYARFAAFDVEVLSVANIKFLMLSSELTATSINVDTQGELNGLSFVLLDSAGKSLDDGAVTVTSSNPGVFFPFKDNVGHWRFFAQDNGTVTLTVTAPDGFSKSLTVNISVPNTPKVLSVGLTYSVMSNKGDITNYFNALATEPVGVGWQNLTVRDQDTQWTQDSKQATTAFRLNEGEAPGMYLFSGYTYSGTWETGYTETSKRFALLTVENDSSRGLISGRITDLSPSAIMHMMNGTLELYDASSQTMVKQQLVYLFGEPVYTLPYVAPGNYKLRFVPGDTRKAPQWYPNASSFANAGTITVTAGNTVSGINFFNNTIELREAIDFSTPDIFTSGFKILSSDTGWYGQRAFTHDNADALQTPALQDDGVAFVEGTIEGPGTLTFWWKVSSEQTADALTFTLNWNMGEQLAISGEVGWTQVTVELPSGPNTVAWQYTKNSSGSGGMDAAWLDQISFTPSGVTTSPSIQVHPQSRTANVGNDVQFTVTASGTPPLYYQWKKNGEPLDGQTADTLNLANVQVGHAGTYTVIVSNSVGVATSDPATLTVYVPPSVSTPPVNLTVSPNRSVTFNVVATGTGPLTYQWQLNGSNIEGANSDTLVISPTVSAKAGLYNVVITGPGGSAASTAHLTVVDLQMFSGAQAGLIISGATGNQYRIDYTTSLNAPITWTELRTVTLTSSPQTVLDETSPGQPRRFYKAILK